MTAAHGRRSRRSFLKGAGVAAAAVAGSAALAGCASGSTGAASQDWMPKSWDYECDLLVVGYGSAGMWASHISADECGPAGARAGEGARARRRQQLHQQRQFDHRQRCGGTAAPVHQMTQDVDTPSRSSTPG